MEIRLDSEVLTKALSRASGVVKRGGPMPVLSSVLLRASEPAGLTVYAFDGEMGLRACYAAKTTKPGAVVLRHKELNDIARALPKGEVVLRTTPHHRARIECGRAVFNLAGQEQEAFPSLPSAEDVKPFGIDAGQLIGLIEKAEHAISGDDTRANLSGLYFDGALRVVAADGHRLALAEVNGPAAPGVIVPRKAVAEMRRLLESSEGEVKLGFTAGAMLLAAGGAQLTARLIAGEFPDYERIIPRGHPNVLVVDKDSLSETIRRLSTLASGVMRFDLSTGKVKLSVQNPDVGDAEEEIEASYEGVPMAIGFNPKYLLDALDALDATRVRIGLGDSSSPALLQAENDSGFTSVIMPMRVEA